VIHRRRGRRHCLTIRRRRGSDYEGRNNHV
jgi:hypothetical protein